MNINMSLTLLFVFASISTLITEWLKIKFFKDKETISYNVVALIVSMVVGSGGCAIYYQLSSIPFITNNIIIVILMGLATALSSMVTYDKVKQTIEQLKKVNVIPETKEEN